MISSLEEQFSKEENKSLEKNSNYYIEKNTEYLNHFNIEINLEIKWKRPKEIVEDPCLLETYENEIDGHLIGGVVTPKWFPVVVTLLKTKDLLHLVIQNIEIQDNYNKSSYDGSFEFSFFNNNIWHKIKIDDRLPLIDDDKKRLFCISSNKEEFLPSLLEKAYAKFLGSYGKLQSIDVLEGLMNFTGGIIETIELERIRNPLTSQDQKSFFKKIKSLSTDAIFMCCTMEKKKEKIDKEENHAQYSLSGNHFYLLTEITTIPAQCNLNLVDTLLFKFVKRKNEAIDMFRLRNPILSGDWNGPFSVGSSEWESISSHVRNYCNMTFDHEFEFWISMDDFTKIMENIVICHIPCCRFLDSVKNRKDLWYNIYYRGKYSSLTPGGCLDDLSNDFLKNDQYFLEIVNQEKVDIKIVLSVVCFDKLVRFNDGCGIVLLKVENNRCFRIHNIKNSKIKDLNILSENGNSSSVSTILSKGKFVLLPWRNGITEVEYYIRIYISNKCINFSSLLQEDKPPYVHCLKCNLMKTFSKTKLIFPNVFGSRKNSDCSIKKENCISCIANYPESALRMTVISVQDLETNHDKSNKNTYFVLKTSDYTYKSVTIQLTKNPIWNESFIFYRTRKQPLNISLEVFSAQCIGFDKSMGIHEFKDFQINADEITVPLRIPTKNEWIQTNAKVTVKFKIYALADFDTC